MAEQTECVRTVILKEDLYELQMKIFLSFIKIVIKLLILQGGNYSIISV